jgi:glutamate transport system permease protein
LFDAPGPKARLRHRLYAIVGIAAIVGAVGFVVYRFDDTGQFDGEVWSWLEYSQIQKDLLSALGQTLQAFAYGSVLAMLFGAIFAAGRLSEHRVVRWLSTVIVEFFRAIPLLIMMFFLFYGLPVFNISLSPLVAVVIALTLYNGSVIAEIFRAGIQALPKGQTEAAYALGMRKTRVMTSVLLPQALSSMMPTLVSQLVVLMKDTALGFLISYPELLYYAKYLGGIAEFGRPIVPVTLVVGAMYILINLLLSWLANYLERRNRRSKKVSPQLPPAAAVESQMTAGIGI